MGPPDTKPTPPSGGWVWDRGGPRGPPNPELKLARPAPLPAGPGWGMGTHRYLWVPMGTQGVPYLLPIWGTEGVPRGTRYGPPWAIPLNLPLYSGKLGVRTPSRGS